MAKNHRLWIFIFLGPTSLGAEAVWNYELACCNPWISGLFARRYVLGLVTFSRLRASDALV